VQIANTITLAIALTLAARSGKHGRPFVAAAALVAVSMLLFDTVGRSPSWQALFARFADVPLVPAIAAAAVAGAAIGWAGWVAGTRIPTTPAAQPA
jgi:hypothetical protein